MRMDSKKLKTILVLSNDSAYTYDLRKETLEELLRSYEVYVAVPAGEKLDLLKAMGCRHIPVSLEKKGTNPLHDLRLFREYNRIMKQLRPDLMLSYTIKPNVYGGMTAQRYHIPQIANITGLGIPIERKGMMQNLTVLLHKIAFRRVYCVFFQNEDNRLFFQKRKLCRTSCCELLPGSGVNTEKYGCLPYPSQENGMEFLFISRIIKEKGIEEYLHAAKVIRSRYPFAHFHVLGICDPKYQERIQEAVGEGTILYHGRTNNVIPYIEQCHCLVHPSYYPEGLSNVCLEAASSGRPVITTNRSGCRETVEDGVTGYIVETQNVSQLVDSIKRFIELPSEEKEQMGRMGRDRMIRYFDRSKVVAAYMRQIEKQFS